MNDLIPRDETELEKRRENQLQQLEVPLNSATHSGRKLPPRRGCGPRSLQHR